MDHLLSVPASPALHSAAWPAAESAASAPVVVERLTGPGALRALQPVWNDVVSAAGMDHPFATHEWVSSWWEAFGGSSCLSILTARSTQTITAIAPLMRPGASGRLWQRNRWTSLHNAHTPRCDWAVGGRRADGYAALWQFLQRDLHDGLELADVPEGSPTLTAMAGLAEPDGWLVGLKPAAWSPRVRTTGTWEAYVASLSPRHRSNMRSRLNRLSRLGPVRMETVSGGAHLGEALERGFWLESAAWKRDAGTAIVSDSAVRDFYTRLAERAAAQGWLRLLFLTAGERRIAFAYALEYRDRLFLIKIGYDPEYARQSPGHLLFWCLLQDAFHSQVREVDFLGVGESWKRDWTADGQRHCNLTVLRDTARGRLEHALRFHAMPLLKRSGLYTWCRGASPHGSATADGRSAHAG